MTDVYLLCLFIQYPQWTGRRDRRGIPIYVYVIKDLNSKNMAAYSSSASAGKTSATHTSSKVLPRLLRLFALYENMTQFVLPLCSDLGRPHPETPVVNTTNIVDISGVGLKQFWNLKGHMQDASALATAHYPETLDRIFVCGDLFFCRSELLLSFIPFFLSLSFFLFCHMLFRSTLTPCLVCWRFRLSQNGHTDIRIYKSSKHFPPKGRGNEKK